PIQELHDAHRIGRPAVIREDEFRDPEVARADDAAHREALRVRPRDARGLDVVPAPYALARLRILEQCVLPVYLVLNIEVICVRGGHCRTAWRAGQIDPTRLRKGGYWSRRGVCRAEYPGSW